MELDWVWSVETGARFSVWKLSVQGGYDVVEDGSYSLNFEVKWMILRWHWEASLSGNSIAWGQSNLNSRLCSQEKHSCWFSERWATLNHFLHCFLMALSAGCDNWLNLSAQWKLPWAELKLYHRCFHQHFLAAELLPACLRGEQQSLRVHFYSQLNLT